MKLTRENVRVAIYYDFCHGLYRQQCIDQLTTTFGDESPFNSEFKCSRRSFTDEFQELPKSVVVPENFNAVLNLVLSCDIPLD